MCPKHASELSLLQLRSVLASWHLTLYLCLTVVTVQMYILFSYAKLIKEMMKVTNNCITALPGRRPLIYQIVDLLMDGLTRYPGQATLPSSKEIDGTRLPWVGC